MSHLFQESCGGLILTSRILRLSPCRSFSTPFSVTLTSGTDGIVLVPRDGMLDVSSIVNTDENCWFRREVFVCRSPCRFPSERCKAITSTVALVALNDRIEFLAGKKSSCTISGTYELKALLHFCGVDFCRRLYLCLSLSLRDVFKNTF